MDTPDRFEKIYEVNGVPITLFEIEEWWDNAPLEGRRHFLSPDTGDQARYAIAAQIVREMANKNEAEKLEILKTFKKAHQQQRESLGVEIGRRGRIGRGIGYDPDFRRIAHDDASEMSWGGSSGYYSAPSVPSVSRMPPRPPDLDRIVSGDPTGHMGTDSIFQQAMRMAEDKLKKEEDQKRKAAYAHQQAEYIRFQQQQRFYQQSQVNVEIEQKKSWKELLGFSPNDVITKDQMVKAFRKKAMEAHPDRGGSEQNMSDLIDARNQALKELD